MVIRLLKKLVILLVMFSLNFLCVAQESLKKGKIVLSIDKSSGELARPMRVNLYGINIKEKISNIDLTPLKNNFGVIVDYVISDAIDPRWPKKHVQILKLKLYPKKTGEIKVPQIYFNNTGTREQTVFIQKGDTNSPILNVSVKNPYEQQQFVAYITIQTPSSTSRLTIDPEHKIKNFESAPLEFTRNKTNNGLYELRIGWALTALKSGKVKLNFPPVEYTVSGVSRKKFFIPEANVNIRNLPLYLPPTTPIGNVDIKSSISNKGILNSNELYYWGIELSGDFNSSFKLPPILREVKSNSQIKFFPAITTRTFENTPHHLTSIVKYSIPFKPLKSGFLTFPLIKLQFYDPVIGKINTYTHDMNRIYVLSFFWKQTYFFLLLFIFMYLLKLIYKKWQIYNFSKSKREDALKELQGIEVKNLKKALELLIEAEYWEKNITVTQWGKEWKNKYRTNHSFDNLVKSLSSCFYSSSEEYNIKELSLQLEHIIKNKISL